MNNRLLVSALTTVALALGGCVGMSQKQNVYATGQVQQSMKVRLATVIDVREVDIESKTTGTGAMAGGAAGAVAATGIDTRHGIVAGVAGAVVGGVAGDMAEKALGKKTGVEIVYRIDGAADVEALVQEADEQALKPGDRIRLIQGQFAVRAVRLPPGMAN